jgi:hypothetical protein
MRFYFHYNKPASQKAGEPRLSLHFQNACHIVPKIDCRVKINSRNRKSQPHCVMAGEARKITIKKEKALIV